MAKLTKAQQSDLTAIEKALEQAKRPGASKARAQLAHDLVIEFREANS